MPSNLTFPGVYIEEIPSPVRTITAVETAVPAFVGRARRGPVNRPTVILSMADFTRTFGGLWEQSEMPHAVSQYFLNGGSKAVVVRLHNGAATGSITLTGGAGAVLQAKNPGSWFRGVTATVDSKTRKDSSGNVNSNEYNLTLTLTETDPVTGAQETTTETYLNLQHINPAASNYAKTVIDRDSAWVSVSSLDAATRPIDQTVNGSSLVLSDGNRLGQSDFIPAAGVDSKQGIYALADADLFTLMMLPPYAENETPAGGRDLPFGVWSAALAFCKDRRAMLLVDSPSAWTTRAAALTELQTVGNNTDRLRDRNSVLYFPWVRMADPLKDNKLRDFPPSAVMAGVMARTDTARGVWKAPAGEEARLFGVPELVYKLTDAENGLFNPIAINCLRTFPITGTVCWGARTLAGANAQGSEWKYLPVRRTALMIEETLYRSLKWVVFEPNDEPLWAQIRLNVGAFMNSLFRQGAFQGATPREAYFVRCDKDTTTQDDINKGIVNILVGFAPLKPVEFVVIKISQIAGQIPT